MKKIVLLVVIIISNYNKINAQTYDAAIEKVCNMMAKKLNTFSNIKVAVYPFINEINNKSLASIAITDDFWSYLTNVSNNFSVMDRETLDYYMEEHELNDNGLIDPNTAKQFGMLIAADAYITGKVRIFPTYLKINTKAVNTQTGTIMAAGIGRVPLDYETAQYLGIDNWQEKKTEADRNRSPDPNCEVAKTGDYCITNNTPNVYKVSFYTVGSLIKLDSNREISLQPGETNCMRQIYNGTYQARIYKVPSYIGDPSIKVPIYIEVCGVGNYTIGDKKNKTKQNSIKNTSQNTGSICFENRNMYPRNIQLTNKITGTTFNLKVERAGWGKSETSCEYDLPTGNYSLEVYTVFTGKRIEKKSISVDAKKSRTVRLATNHYN
jgi:TolB-like protein